MIANTQQEWAKGSQVKVGFLTLTVISARETPGNYKPDEYLLQNDKGTLYVFVPHNGLSRVHASEVPAVLRTFGA